MWLIKKIYVELVFFFRNTFTVRDKAVKFRNMLELLVAWYEKPLGRASLALEHDFIEKLMRTYHGKRIAFLSPVSLQLPAVESPFRSVYRVVPQLPEGETPADCAVSNCSIIVSDFDALPFDDESIDIVVLHHLLEFSQKPQQVLKEASRITAHGGHLAIVAFNPVSVSGFCALVLRVVNVCGISQRRILFNYRMRDWLAFLEFSHLKTHHLCHFWPITNEVYLRAVSGVASVLGDLNVPFSSVFALVSRKDQTGLRMVGQNWRSQIFNAALLGRRGPETARSASKIIKFKPIDKIRKEV